MALPCKPPNTVHLEITPLKFKQGVATLMTVTPYPNLIASCDEMIDSEDRILDNVYFAVSKAD